MNKICGIILLIIICNTSTAQFISKVEFISGGSFSKLISEPKIDIFSETYEHDITYGGGVIYFDHKFWHISTNLWIVKKGGYQDIGIDPFKILNPRLNYFSFNTLLSLKLPVDKIFIPYVSLGPRYDILEHHSSDFDGVDKAGFLKHHNLGFIISAGINYEFKRLTIGAEFIKYINSENIAEWSEYSGYIPGTIDDKTICVVFTIAYKLSRKTEVRRPKSEVGSKKY